MRWKSQRSWRRADYGKSRQGIQFGVGRETALITKDTKCPEGVDLYLLPAVCSPPGVTGPNNEVVGLGSLKTKHPPCITWDGPPCLTPLPTRPPGPNRAAGTIWPPVCWCSRSH